MINPSMFDHSWSVSVYCLSLICTMFCKNHRLNPSGNASIICSMQWFSRRGGGGVSEAISGGPRNASSNKKENTPFLKKQYVQWQRPPLFFVLLHRITVMHCGGADLCFPWDGCKAFTAIFYHMCFSRLAYLKRKRSEKQLKCGGRSHNLVTSCWDWIGVAL